VSANQNLNLQIINALLERKSVLLTSHIRADGDSIGAACAMREFLTSRGIEATVCCDGDVPEIYKFLLDADQLNTTPAIPYDATVVLDCPNLERVGKVKDKITPEMFIINIDHHPGNENYGDINLVAQEASSTSELIYHILREAKVAISPQIARALYVGIITDTGRFSHGNTRREAFQIAAELMDSGLNPAQVSTRLYQNTPVKTFKLQAEVMAGLRFALDGRVAYISISKELFQKTGTLPIDTQEFSDIPRNIEGVDVGIFFREEPGKDYVKISLRTTDAVDANAVASEFGGGGHHRAAGFSIKAALEEAERMVLKKVAAALET